MKPLLVLVALLLALSLPALTAPGHSAPQDDYDPLEWTTGTFKRCPAEGRGNRSDPVLNSLKNRDVPPPSYRDFSVRDIVANRPARALAQGAKGREKWTDERALEEVERWERLGARVEGYVVAFVQEDPEACNCKSPRYRDYHVWLAPEPDQSPSGRKDKRKAMVVEISPRLLPDHPNWNAVELAALRDDQTKVRISGWLMWDQEHPSFVGRSRATIWEIHPIHLIEYKEDGRWYSLDD